MRRPILYGLRDGRTFPIYGVGPWWVHAIYWTAGLAADKAVKVLMWAHRRLREEPPNA